MKSDDYDHDRCSSCTESLFAQRPLSGGGGSLRTLPGCPKTSKSCLLLQYLENQLRSTLATQAAERDRLRADDDDSTSEPQSQSSRLIGVAESSRNRVSDNFYENLPADPSVLGQKGSSSGSDGARDLEVLEGTGGGCGQKALSRVIRLGVRTRFSSTGSERDLEPEEASSSSSRRYPVPASIEPAVAAADHRSIDRCCCPAAAALTSDQPSSSSSPSEEVHGRCLSPTTGRDPDPVVCPRPSGTVLYSNQAQSVVPSWDLEQLQLVHYRLTICGFYWGRMTTDEARTRLERYPVGTFLLRDSSDRRYLFSLSVQTQRGTTSIRVVYESGLFRMDSEPDQKHLMPTFDCVLRMIQYYRRLCLGRGGCSPVRNSYVFLERSGRRDTRVLLRRSVEVSPRCLVHLCRLRIHGVLKDNGVARLPLTPSLKLFLLDYPYDV